ncbi:MAG: response regulator [Spartobacteria bacterium]|nr:response regulator [Spartobacteria bacterium]
MRTLIVEDDFAGRRLLQKLMAEYSEIDIAVDGIEAVKAVKQALAAGNPYDLICLDIMMPGMDGQEALREIRHVEKEHGILGLDGVKIVMTTALKDAKNVITAFREQCEGYIVKPVERDQLEEQLIKLGLIEKPSAK